MTDLSESNALAKPQADKLSPEDLSLRRLGIAAAVQMFIKTEAVAGNAKDETYDASHVEVQRVLAEYLQALPRHPPAAQQGFLFVLADHLISAYGDTGIMYRTPHQRAVVHTNPPLTRMQMIKLKEHLSRDHNWSGGVPLAPKERAALAQKWRAAFKRVNAADPLPTTERQGKARFVRLIREIENANWKREAPVFSRRAVVAALKATATWPASAQEGFAAGISEWLEVEVSGFGLNVGAYADRHGDPADEERFALLTEQRCKWLEELVERTEARKAARRASRPATQRGAQQ